MAVLLQILAWLFGTLAVAFLIVAVISLFSFGSSPFWVSDKANQKSHLYLLFSAVSVVGWFIATYPKWMVQAIFCVLPFSIFLVGFLYFKSRLGRELFYSVTKKTGIDYPFKDKK